jgi:hypothetical protein
VRGQRHAPAALYPPGKTRYPLYRRLGGPQGRYGQVRKISPTPTGIRSPDRPARSQSLYRLSHPALTIYTTAFFHTTNLQLFLSFDSSVRNWLAAPPLLQTILYTVFNYDQDTGWRTGEARFHYRQGHWLLSTQQSLRPTQPAHAVGLWDHFPDGKTAGS